MKKFGNGLCIGVAISLAFASGNALAHQNGIWVGEAILSTVFALTVVIG